MAKFPSFKDVGRVMGFEFSEGERLLSKLDQNLKNLEYYSKYVEMDFLDSIYENLEKVEFQPKNPGLVGLQEDQMDKTTFKDMFCADINSFILNYRSLVNSATYEKSQFNDLLRALEQSLIGLRYKEIPEKLREFREKIFNLIEGIE